MGEAEAAAKAKALAAAKAERAATIKGNDELWVANMPPEVVGSFVQTKVNEIRHHSLKLRQERTPTLTHLTPTLMMNDHWLTIELNSLNYYLSTSSMVNIGFFSYLIFDQNTFYKPF